MTDKQMRFIAEYLTDCNATQAAIRAGYSPKTANEAAAKNMRKNIIREEIERRLEEMQSEKIADAVEVMIYLTSVMRGETISPVLCPNGKIVEMHPDESQRLKAAELLGKRYRMFTEKVDLNPVPVIIGGADQLED